MNNTSNLDSTSADTCFSSFSGRAKLNDLKKAFGLELSNNIERIKVAFRAIGYDPNARYGEGRTGRWIDIPEGPANDGDLQKAFAHLLATVLTKLGIADSRNTRHVWDTTTTLLQHGDNADHSTSPDICIVATGPSFELPHVKSNEVSKTIGYSNLSTAIDVETENGAQDYLAQIERAGIYARQMFIQQPNRKFVRTLVATERHVRLLHFDRSGVKYTPLLNFHENPCTFVRLILGLSSHREEVLGLDTNIQWRTRKGKKAAGTIKMVGSDQKAVIYDLIDVHPVFHRAALCGRGTTCWHARDRKGHLLDPVLIKDAWRGEDRASEHTMLEKVKGVNGVSQMLHYCDNLAQTKDFRGSRLSDQPNFFNRVWLRVVLKQYGRSLQHLTSQRQAIGAFRDTLAGKLLEHKSVLHRDISMQNLLLGLPDALPGLRGILVDFDMAVQAEGRDASQISVDCPTGTRMYQSLSVLYSYEATSNATAHDYLDDIESFFLVLAHLMFGWSGIEQEIKPKPRFLQHWNNEDPRLARMAKEVFILKALDMAAIPVFWSDPCRDLLESFHGFLKGITEDKERVRKAANPKLRLKRLQKLHAHRKAHYNTVKAMFDKALDDIERYGEKPSAHSSEDTDSEEDMFGSSPIPLARSLKRELDDVEETPNKRNCAAGYSCIRP